MARSVPFKVGGKTHKLIGSFAAAERICNEVVELVVVQREVSFAAMMAERGLPYSPRWQMKLKDIVDILEVGLDEIGASVERADIETECFKMGVDVAHNLAVKYLQLFFAEPENLPESTPDEEGKDAGK